MAIFIFWVPRMYRHYVRHMIHTHTHTHIYTHTYTHIYTHINTHIHTYTHTQKHTRTHIYILNETIIWGKYYYHFMVQRGLCSLPKITWLVNSGTEIQTNLASITLHITLTLASMFCSQNKFCFIEILIEILI